MDKNFFGKDIFEYVKKLLGEDIIMIEKYFGKNFLEYLKHHIQENTIITRSDGKKFLYNAEKQTVSLINEENIKPEEENIENEFDEFDEWFSNL